MKKVLIILFTLTSVGSFAKNGINVYGKFGLDVYSRFNAIKDEGETIVPKKGKVGANFALEVTKNITPNFELGGGLAYTIRKDSKIHDSDIDSRFEERWNFTMPRYESIPLYLTAKYNFETNSTIKPYVKADLGYSFNRVKKNIKINWEEKDLRTNTIDSGTDKVRVKTTNGMYLGVGVGFEYNNFVTDLSYVHTNSNFKWYDEDDKTWEKNKYNNGSIRLSVGYKFSF